MKQPPSSKRRPAEPLETRHVFFDTQVYRALKYNPENPAIKTLKDHILAHRVVLHMTDITLLEVKRQLLEAAQTRARELSAIEKDLRRWRKQAPKATPKLELKIDAAAIGEELYDRFYSFITQECRAKVHRALTTVSAEDIFQSYFARRAPFDREEAKEFPDAFAVVALSKWAATSGDKIYVVTQDGAMGRSANADPNLLSLTTIDEVISRAAAEMGPEVEGIAEALLNAPGFDASFELLLQAVLKDAAFVYAGDLAEGRLTRGN
jgi:PIN domain